MIKSLTQKWKRSRGGGEGVDAHFDGVADFEGGGESFWGGGFEAQGCGVVDDEGGAARGGCVSLVGKFVNERPAHGSSDKGEGVYAYPRKR